MGAEHKKRTPASTPAARSTARTPSLPGAAARSRPHPGRALSGAQEGETQPLISPVKKGSGNPPETGEIPAIESSPSKAD